MRADRQSLTILLIHLLSGACGNLNERRLTSHLLKDYDPDIAPTGFSAEKLIVTFGLALNQIIDLDERNQILTANMWLRMYWKDEHLVWNETEFNGVQTIRLSVNRIWRPDVTLYNSVSEKMPELERYLAAVRSDGSVRWLAPAIIKSSCPLNVLYFPWDRQVCIMKWGSWSYDGTTLDIYNRSESGDMSDFVTNGEWELVAFPVRRNVDYFKCCPEPYPSLIYEIIIQRKSLYYVTNLLIPCAFITACSLLVFWLPPESGEKVALSVTILLTTTVFLLLVAETMPAQSIVIPLVSQYFLAVLLMLAMSTLTTVILLNFHHRGDLGENVPSWMRKLVLHWLAYPVGMRGLVRQHEEKRRKQNEEMKKVQSTRDMDAQLSSFIQSRSSSLNGVSYLDVRHGQKKMEEVLLGVPPSFDGGLKINPAFATPNGSCPQSPMNGNVHKDNSEHGRIASDFSEKCDFKEEEMADYEMHEADDKSPSDESLPVLIGLKKIIDLLDVFRSRMDHTQKQERRVSEWMLVSEILDRIFLILFTLFTAGVNVAVMFAHP